MAAAEKNERQTVAKKGREMFWCAGVRVARASGGLRPSGVVAALAAVACTSTLPWTENER